MVARVLGLLVAVVTPFGVGPATAPGKTVSWADPSHTYGWTDVTREGPVIQGAAADPRCFGTNAGGGSTAYLCATEDGGTSWHRIFQAGRGFSWLGGYARTSSGAGLVTIGQSGRFPRTLRTGVFWTIDNGRHWFETTRIAGGIPDHDGAKVGGRGGELFWTESAGSVLYQLLGWPPRRIPKCEGFFTWHTLDQHARAAGNICVGAPSNAGLRSAVVWRLSGSSFRGLLPVPNGIAALAVGKGPAVLVHQGTKNRLRTLPDHPAGLKPTAYRIEGEWPNLRVLAIVYPEGPSVPRQQVVWVSNDGGETWTVHVET
jgi:hypothetical protein